MGEALRGQPPSINNLMEIKAYAKINLTLEVLGRRPDGYHEVRTVLQTIDLKDILNITPASHLKVECSVPGLDNEDNLVWKAASALRTATGCNKGAKIHLEKHIPVGMGLGGGSSDAAATLKALNSLWGIQMDDTGLQSIAASLGSDVPFFLKGGTALGEGRGEIMTDLHPLPQLWMVLCCSPSRSSSGSGPFPPKTARLYSMVTPEHYTNGTHTSGMVDFIESYRNPTVGTGEAEPLPSLFNVFESLAYSAFGELEVARQALVETGARNTYLSGAGPALFTFVSDKGEGEEIVKSLKESGLEAYCTSTVGPDIPSDVERD